MLPDLIISVIICAAGHLQLVGHPNVRKRFVWPKSYGFYISKGYKNEQRKIYNVAPEA